MAPQGVRAHSEPVKLLVRFSGPLSARRILRERWLGLPMSLSAGMRGVLGARPLLSHVRAVSGAWLPPSPEWLPIRALSCLLLQKGDAPLMNAPIYRGGSLDTAQPSLGRTNACALLGCGPFLAVIHCLVSLFGFKQASRQEAVPV